MSVKHPSELAVLLSIGGKAANGWIPVLLILYCLTVLIDSIYFCLTESICTSVFLLCFVFFIFLLSFNLQKFNNM